VLRLSSLRANGKRLGHPRAAVNDSEPRPLI
jgi:hypothetical protein